jgi:endo-1,4-beta-xylanase
VSSSNDGPLGEAGGPVTSAEPYVHDSRVVSRRALLIGAMGAAGLIGCTSSTTRSLSPTNVVTSAGPAGIECPALEVGGRLPLWETALQSGLVYGSSAATWQLSDDEYRRLFAREAAILFTEDDLLWWRLRPTPQSNLDFTYGDRVIEFAEQQGMLVFGAHLVWDEGFGEGWTDDDLWGLKERAARDLMLDTIDRVVGRYRGRVAGWIVANEVLDGYGLRVDVPWYATIGPSYVSESFHTAHEADPEALLVLNDFGYETDDMMSLATDKRAATLQLIDELLGAGVPVHALGVQAHLHAMQFSDTFDPGGYRQFLSDVAARGMRILVTEMDVLDDGLPPNLRSRDRAVADVVSAYLDVVLDEPAVSALMTFGLSDRYTWLEEDFPRTDGVPRRPLPFDEELRPKPAYQALKDGLESATPREVLWLPPRC